ncbi:hypothetical protein H4Q26_002594 [Puccinia striiformis f. sp. tritici PST-130]|nr:hypothetical protein H4Q26_002594 [Puccinia striiformis f. sp. tritici PST-130]
MTPPTLRPRNSNGTSRARKPSGSVPTPLVDPALPPLPPPPTYAEIPPPSSPSGRAIQLQYLRAVHEQCVVGFQSNMKLHDMMVKQFRKITAHEDHRVDLEDHSLAEIKLRLGDVETKVDQLHVVIPENQERTSEQLSRYLNRVERMFEDGEDTVSKLHNKVHNLEVKLQEHHRDNRALLEAQFNTFQDVLSRVEAQSVHASLTLNTLEAKLVSSMEHQLQGIQTRITCNCLNSNAHTACHQASSQVNSSTPPGQEMSRISPPGEETKIVPSISPTPAPQQTFNNHNTKAENNASPCLSDITAAPWGSMNKDMHKMILQTMPKRKSKKKVQNLTPDDNESSSSDNHSDTESLPSDQEDSDESGYSSNAILQEDPKNISSIQVIQHEKLPSKIIPLPLIPSQPAGQMHTAGGTNITQINDGPVP